MSRFKSLAAFVLLSLIWGTQWVAVSELDGRLPLFRTCAIRYGTAAGVLLVLAVAGRAPLPGAREVRSAAMLGCTLVALPFVLSTLASKTVPLATSAVFFAMMPVALVLAGAAGGGLPPRRRSFYAALVGFSGMTVAMSSMLVLSAGQISGAVMLVAGMALMIVSVAFAKRELRGPGILLSCAVQLSVAAVIVEMISLATERSSVSNWSPSVALALGCLSLFASVVALPLFYWLLGRVETYQLAALWWMQPLISIVQIALVFRERLSFAFYLGSIGVLACTGVLFRAAGEENWEVLSIRATR